MDTDFSADDRDKMVAAPAPVFPIYSSMSLKPREPAFNHMRVSSIDMDLFSGPYQTQNLQGDFAFSISNQELENPNFARQNEFDNGRPLTQDTALLPNLR